MCTPESVGKDVLLKLKCSQHTLSHLFLRGQCKEHDLAMINQLLDDPKLTARKYREWKLMNTLLIQDMYQQQRAAPALEGELQDLRRLPSGSGPISP